MSERLDLLLQGLFTIHVGEKLGHGRLVGRDHSADLGSSLERAHECENIFRQRCRVIATGAIFDHHGHAAGCSNAWNGRRWEGKRNSIWIAAQLLLQIRLNVLQLLLLAFARGPRLEGDEEKSGVRALYLGEQREVGDGNDALNARSLAAARQ